MMMVARAPLALLPLACMFFAEALANGSLRTRLSHSSTGPLLQALQLPSLGLHHSQQSPGPTSVPSGADSLGGADSSGEVVGPGSTGAGSSEPVPAKNTPAETSGVGAIVSAQTPAPRFDTGVVPEDLQAHSARSEDTLVDSIELAQVSEVKRVVFRALSKLRAAQIEAFDAVAKRQTGAIDDFNDHLNFRRRFGVNYTEDEDSGEDLPVFLPGEEPWWSAPGGPDWTQDLDNTTSDDRRGKPASAKRKGLPGRTSDGEPCICYPELIQVAAPAKDEPVSSALAEIRACCAGSEALHRTSPGV